MAVRSGNEIVFPEQSLPAGRMIGLGLQHVIAMFGAKVFSIRPLQVAACTAILLGLVPKFGALIGSIPVPVMGGISFLLFGLIAGTSSKVISTAEEDWGTLENFGVFGISIALCTAMVAKGVTVKLGGIVLDPIGASTFAAVFLNLAIVLVKKVSPFAESAPQTAGEMDARGIAERATRK